MAATKKAKLNRLIALILAIVSSVVCIVPFSLLYEGNKVSAADGHTIYYATDSYITNGTGAQTGNSTWDSAWKIYHTQTGSNNQVAIYGNQQGKIKVLDCDATYGNTGTIINRNAGITNTDGTITPGGSEINFTLDNVSSECMLSFAFSSSPIASAPNWAETYTMTSEAGYYLPMKNNSYNGITVTMRTGANGVIQSIYIITYDGGPKWEFQYRNPSVTLNTTGNNTIGFNADGELVINGTTFTDTAISSYYNAAYENILYYCVSNGVPASISQLSCIQYEYVQYKSHNQNLNSLITTSTSLAVWSPKAISGQSQFCMGAWRNYWVGTSSGWYNRNLTVQYKPSFASVDYNKTLSGNFYLYLPAINYATVTPKSITKDYMNTGYYFSMGIACPGNIAAFRANWTLNSINGTPAINFGKSFEIEYVLNGGQNPADAPTSATYGETVSLPTPTPPANCPSFDYWSYSYNDASDIGNTTGDFAYGQETYTHNHVSKITLTAHYIECDHNWSGWTYNSSTKKHERTCSKCNHTEAVACTWSSGVQVTAPTCTTKGTTKYTCTVCSGTKIEEDIPALGHNYTVKQSTVAPTCLTSGYTTYKCSRCSSTAQLDQTSALGHNYNTWTQKTGYEIRKCSRCTAFDRKRITITLNANVANHGSSVSPSTWTKEIETTDENASISFDISEIGATGVGADSYVLTGWSTSATGSITNTFTFTKNATIYAIWTDRATISFFSGSYGNGNTISNKLVTGSSYAVGTTLTGGAKSSAEQTNILNNLSSNYNGIGLGGDPNGTGSWFAGWNTQDGGIGQWAPTTAGMNGKTLYAVWGYPLSWNANGGAFKNSFKATSDSSSILHTFVYYEGSIKNDLESLESSFTRGANYNYANYPTSSNLTRSGYTFDGFYYVSSGSSTKVTGSSTFTSAMRTAWNNGTVTKTVGNDDAGRFEFFAGWKPTITFNKNGGTLSSGKTDNQTRVGSIVSGAPGTVTTSTSGNCDHLWTPSCTVTTPTGAELGYNSSNSSKPYLIGWARTASATVPEYPAGATVYISEATTLYAVWGDSLVVTYNAQLGVFSNNASSAVRMVVPNTVLPIPSTSSSELYDEIPSYFANGYYWGFRGWSTSADTFSPVFSYNYKTGWTKDSSLTVTSSTTLYAHYCGHGDWNTKYEADPVNGVTWVSSKSQGTAWDSSYCSVCGKEVKRRFAIAFRARQSTEATVENKHKFYSGFVFFESNQTTATVSAEVMGFSPCEVGTSSATHFRGWTIGVDSGNAAVYKKTEVTISGNTNFIASYDSGYIEYLLLSRRIKNKDSGMCLAVSANYISLQNKLCSDSSGTSVSKLLDVLPTDPESSYAASYSQVLVKKPTDYISSTYNRFPVYETWQSRNEYYNSIYAGTAFAYRDLGTFLYDYDIWSTKVGNDYVSFYANYRDYSNGKISGNATNDRYNIDKYNYNNGADVIYPQITTDTVWEAKAVLRYYAYSRFADSEFKKASFSSKSKYDIYGLNNYSYVSTLVRQANDYHFPNISAAPDGSYYGNGPTMTGRFEKKIEGVTIPFYTGYTGIVPKFKVSTLDSGATKNLRVMQCIRNNLESKYKTAIGAFWDNNPFMSIEPFQEGGIGEACFQNTRNASIYFEDGGYYAMYQAWDLGVRFEPGKVNGNTPKLGNAKAKAVYSFLCVTRDTDKFYLLPNDYWNYLNYYIDAWFIDIDKDGELDDFEKTSYSYFPLKGSNIIKPTDSTLTIFDYLYNGYEKAVKLGNSLGISNGIKTLAAANTEMLTLTAHWEKSNYTLILDGSGFNAGASTITYIDGSTSTNTTKTVTMPSADSSGKSIRSVYAKPGTTITIHLDSNSGYQVSYVTKNNCMDYTDSSTGSNDLSAIPDRIISENTDYSFTLGTDTVMTAVFTSESSTTKAVVDRNNHLLTATSSYYNAYALYSTDSSNYRVRQGLVSDSKANMDIRYMLYNNLKNCALTVPSGTLVSCVDKTGSGTSYTIPYDRTVTVTSTNASFKAWVMNGKVVSTNRVYTFRMTESSVALTINTSTSSTAFCEITSKGTDSTCGCYYAVMNWFVPEGCKVIDSGFVITKGAGDGETLNAESIDKRDDTVVVQGQKVYPYKYYKVTSTDMNNSGSFKLMMPTSVNRNFIAYVVYLDKNDTMQTIVSAQTKFDETQNQTTTD